MNKFFKTLLIIFIVLAICFAGLSIYVAKAGKPLIQKLLSQTFQQDVSLGRIYYLPPFNIIVAHVNVGDFFSAEKISINVSPVSLIKGRLDIALITFTKPTLTIDSFQSAANKTSSKTSSSKEPPSNNKIEEPHQTVSQPVTVTKSEEHNVFKVGKLLISEGIFVYTDLDNNGKYAFRMDHCRMEGGPIVMPQPELMHFTFSSAMTESRLPVSIDVIQGQGWIDVRKKNMQAEIKFSNPAGQEGLVLNAISKNNDMTVILDGNLAGALGGPKQSKGASYVLGALNSFGVKIQGQISFNTKMDNFRIPDNMAISGRVVQ